MNGKLYFFPLTRRELTACSISRAEAGVDRDRTSRGDATHLSELRKEVAELKRRLVAFSLVYTLTPFTSSPPSPRPSLLLLLQPGRGG